MRHSIRLGPLHTRRPDGVYHAGVGYSDERITEPHERTKAVPNPSIKNEKMYEDLREDGASKEKAARISNAAAKEGKSSVGRKGGKAGSYDDWTVDELKKRAKELGLTGYSDLRKSELIDALRSH